MHLALIYDISKALTADAELSLLPEACDAPVLRAAVYCSS